MTMATTTPISLPSLPPPLPSIVKQRSHNSLLFTSSLSLSTTLLSRTRKAIHFHDPLEKNRQKRSNKLRYTFASAEEEVLPSDSTLTPLDDSQQIVSTTGDDGVAFVIQALLFIAFVVLTILSLGVIYIGVQDFLEKREREKFEKEEASTRKNGKKKKKKTVRARAGPRGFGQKTDENEDDGVDV